MGGIVVVVRGFMFALKRVAQSKQVADVDVWEYFSYYCLGNFRTHFCQHLNPLNTVNEDQSMQPV